MTTHFYLTAELLTKLEMSRSTFDDLRKRGKLPFIEEIKPRIGRKIRWRREPVDRYLASNWRPETQREQKRRQERQTHERRASEATQARRNSDPKSGDQTRTGTEDAQSITK